MPNEFRGEQAVPPGRFAVVVSRFNKAVTSKLLEGAVSTLQAASVADRDIDVVWVPGAFEIPLTAQTLAQSGNYRAILCLGAVIRGETSHDQHINRAVSMGLMEAALQSGVPVLFGVLTCESEEQAFERTGGKFGHKGVECAEAALEMASLLDQLTAKRSF